jgi:hypothetical protein
MTNKLLLYSKHARRRMRERGFRRTEVRMMLAVGVVVETVVTAGGQRRFIREAKVRGKRARVIYVESATAKIIITILWVA